MDDNVEETRRSLLDVVLEKVHKAGKQVVVSRLVYVAAVEGKQLTSKTEIEVCSPVVPARVRRVAWSASHLANPGYLRTHVGMDAEHPHTPSAVWVLSLAHVFVCPAVNFRRTTHSSAPMAVRPVDALVSSHRRRLLPQAMHEAVWRRVIDEGEADYTGLLLCFSQCFVGVVEAQTSTLLTFLRELCALPKGERLFSKVRIISSTEDVPSRAYTQWMTAFFKGDDVGKPTPLEDEVLVDRCHPISSCLPTAEPRSSSRVSVKLLPLT